jgi:hypothetical protein
MTDDIEAFFAQAAMVQAIIHADKAPPEKSFDNFDDLMAWLEAHESADPVKGALDHG